MFVHWFTTLAPIKAPPLQKTGLQRSIWERNGIKRPTEKADDNLHIATRNGVQDLVGSRQRGG